MAYKVPFDSFKAKFGKLEKYVNSARSIVVVVLNSELIISRIFGVNLPGVIMKLMTIDTPKRKNNTRPERTSKAFLTFLFDLIFLMESMLYPEIL
ncbi:hypothetical protein P278_24320 [Zhouia amylolytica AD3]|uniref:Uncharacterized protein n=1 Tax=Zhouia amylolytica AD3 TaxID=1286632 RepID=W2UKG4_9FLAO|nr:hypothetical protein P278_24320 [Zhouia amylolytica AD3]